MNMRQDLNKIRNMYDTVAKEWGKGITDVVAKVDGKKPKMAIFSQCLADTSLSFYLNEFIFT